jgi:hypothetical protein
MYKKFLVVFLVFLLFASGAVYSQKNGVELLCSPRKDSVLLRWAPTNPLARICNPCGYIAPALSIAVIFFLHLGKQQVHVGQVQN